MEISLDYEDELDAAREAVRHAVGREVGPQMFPDKSVESAARYPMDALNPGAGRAVDAFTGADADAPGAGGGLSWLCNLVDAASGLSGAGADCPGV